MRPYIVTLGLPHDAVSIIYLVMINNQEVLMHTSVWLFLTFLNDCCVYILVIVFVMFMAGVVVSMCMASQSSHVPSMNQSWGCVQLTAD